MRNPRKVIGGGPYMPTRGKLKGVPYPSRRQYYNALRELNLGPGAKESQYLARPRKIPTKFFESLQVFEQSKGGRATVAVDLMRKEGYSLSAAARRAGTTPLHVKQFYGDVLGREGGKTVVRTPDAAFNPIWVASTEGDVIAYVRSRATRRLIGEHHTAVWYVSQIVKGGKKRSARSKALAAEHLARFGGVRIESEDGLSYELVSDYDEAVRLLRAGLISLEGKVVSPTLLAA